MKLGGQPRLQVESASDVQNWSEKIEQQIPAISSPGLLGVFCGWFMPLEPVGDAVHVNVYTNAHISVPNY